MALNLNVHTCQRCAKLFRMVRSPFCADCLELIESEFKSIRDFIGEHRGTTIAQAAAETGVPEKSILFLVKEGRLSFGTPGEILRCERCGTYISEGRFCNKCVGGLRAEFLTKEIQEGKSAPDPSTVSALEETYNGMHIKSRTKQQ